VKVLYLLRHAKSDWGGPELPDRERGLAPRGVRASSDLASRLQRARVAPALVLCSTAVRARQTLELLAPALGGQVETRYEEDLYGATAADVLERLRGVPGSVPSVMVVGHNPTIQDLTLELAARGRDLDSVRLKFPTAALATLKFDRKGWDRLDRGVAELVAFLTPGTR
jgi:phosphohistidine phosphatase